MCSRRPLCTLALALAPVCACSLFVDVDELSHGSKPDAGSPDGSTDAGSQDGATDAPGVPFCARATHAFCDSFDRTSLMDGWTSTESAPGGELTLSSLRAASPPQSLLVKLPRRDTSKTSEVIVKQWSQTFRRVLVEFDFFLEAPAFVGGDSTAAIVGVEFLSGGGGYGFYAGRGAGLSAIGADDLPPFPTDTWLHAKLDVDPIAKVARGSIGDLLFDVPFPAPAAGSSPAIALRLGVIGYNVPSPTFAIHYDNVAVDFP